MNNKEFSCDSTATIFKGAEASEITLQHSCLSARCRSGVAKVLSGEVENVTDELVLSNEEILAGFTLTCNAKPKSDLLLDIEDLTDYNVPKSKIFPAKINSIQYLKHDVIRLVLRVSPNANFRFLPGQYVNIVKGSIKRSYSIANSNSGNRELVFFIKNYEGGEMSNHLFNGAKTNDLLRIEGSLGSFFLRNTEKTNLVFLATGIGIAPVKSIIESSEQNQKILIGKRIFVIWGGRFREDIFLDFQSYPEISFQKALSREDDVSNSYKGYVQDCLLASDIDLFDSQVYACGFNEMINSAKVKLCASGLNDVDFFSDAFVSTN